MAGLQAPRYSDVAVLLHWLIAIFIIGLLAIGKFTVSLDEADPLRFELTQWHKTFGISVLLLSVVRLVWRFLHKPPAELSSIPKFQQMIASLVHWVLYGLMFALPITGWIMVSASPLNVETKLFGVIHWPHIAALTELPNKAEIAEAFHDYHEYAGNLLIVLLLAHVGAALKHHIVDKDTILTRMLPDWSASFNKLIAAFVVFVGAAGTGLYLYANTQNAAAIVAAGDSEVSFLATVSGEKTPGIFTQSDVTAVINEADLAASSISATVQIESLQSPDSQVESSLGDPEWFDVDSYPTSTFTSTTLVSNSKGDIDVTGTLMMKATEKTIQFPMQLLEEDGKRVARGEFVIDRREFDFGMESQDTDDFVGFEITVQFRFDLEQPDG